MWKSLAWGKLSLRNGRWSFSILLKVGQSRPWALKQGIKWSFRWNRIRNRRKNWILLAGMTAKDVMPRSTHRRCWRTLASARGSVKSWYFEMRTLEKLFRLWWPAQVELSVATIFDKSGSASSEPKWWCGDGSILAHGRTSEAMPSVLPRRLFSAETIIHIWPDSRMQLVRYDLRRLGVIWLTLWCRW